MDEPSALFFRIALLFSQAALDPGLSLLQNHCSFPTSFRPDNEVVATRVLSPDNAVDKRLFAPPDVFRIGRIER